MDRIIHRQVKLNCDQEKAFAMFTQDSKVVTWLAEVARIEAHVGGKYELFWDPDHQEVNSTIGCTITAIERNKLLCFEWKGPSHFPLMNSVRPLTHVSVSFCPDCAGEATEIHLVHTGWRSDDSWEQARLWFDAVWAQFLERLKDRVDGDENRL